jgi:ankyrin repeat protein
MAHVYLNPAWRRAIAAPFSLVAMLTAFTGCGESTPMNPEKAASLELSPEEKRAEEHDRQIMETAKRLNEGKPDPGLPPGAIPVSSLEYWASLGNVGKVKLELQEGADINEKFAGDETALHAAAVNGHVELVKFLLSQGADRTAKDVNGVTPLEMARQANQDEVVKLLETK